jgi:hypothetical protein
MKNKNLKKKSHRKEEIVGAAGALAGGAVGAIGGPAGIVAGAIMGGAIGAAVGHTLVKDDERRHEVDEDLDKAIGVSGGDMGAAKPGQPAAKRGNYSAGSSGAPTPGGSSPSEGPLQSLDDD